MAHLCLICPFAAHRGKPRNGNLLMEINMKYSTPYDIDFSKRDPGSDVDDLFHKRWSPRSLKKISIPEEVVATVIDAARWSPSAHNEQPWLFVTSSNQAEFDISLGLLVEQNQEWAKNASVLGFIFAKKAYDYNGSPNRLADFDCGAAWMAMTLQARMLGLYTHGLGGIHREKTYSALNVSEETHEAICGFVLGVIDQPEQLTKDFREREFPSPRKPLNGIWKNGGF